ncbi:MAG: DNA-directed RNA polymerase subunit alpha [Candidatus Brocadiaceae bacterium]|jgi:DNA-directed RNA polymerase subunit alpha
MAVRVRWRGLELPFQVTYDAETLTDTHGEFVAEPFERGFGHTIGNSLRRVLLSSIEGAAVVAVRIDGVEQELSALEGVREDVPEIVLNIKELVLRVHPDEEKELRVEAHEKGVITAGDIEPDPDVDIINSDQVIATLTEEVDFACMMTVRKGRGYVPSEELDLPKSMGLIPLDALFSPVRKVSYRVEDTRVGRRTNYDRLIIQIETNGAVSPEMALVEGSKILRKHLNPFVEYFELSRQLPQEAPEPIPEVKHLEEPEVPESKLSMPISALDLRARAAHCLEREGVKTVRDLLKMSEDELLEVRNFGSVSLQEVAEKLAELGLEVGQMASAEE